jgi:hypothetical protein
MARYIFILFLILPLLVSCSDEDGSLAGKAGDKIGQTLTDFAGGVGKGVDKQMLVKADLSEKLSQKGLSMSVAKQDSVADKSIVVYLIASENFEGNLLAKAINNDGQEIGRATSELKMAKDEAKYINFKFNEEMDSQLAKKYSVDLL